MITVSLAGQVGQVFPRTKRRTVGGERDENRYDEWKTHLHKS